MLYSAVSLALLTHIKHIIFLIIVIYLLLQYVQQIPVMIAATIEIPTATATGIATSDGIVNGALV